MRVGPVARDGLDVGQHLEHCGGYRIGTQVLDVVVVDAVHTPGDTLEILEVSVIRAVITDLKEDPFRAVRQHVVLLPFVHDLVDCDLRHCSRLAAVHRQGIVNGGGPEKQATLFRVVHAPGNETIFVACDRDF